MSGDVHVRFCESAGVRLPRATHLVILVDGHPKHEWLVTAVGKRLREELARLGVEVNEDKSRVVDLAQGGSFGFLGFEFRRVRSKRGVWSPHYTPQMKKRTAFLRRLKVVFRQYDFEFTVADTGGCSCEQIIEAWALGWGHTKFGCSTGAMLQWIAYVGDYSLAQLENTPGQITPGALQTPMPSSDKPSASAQGTVSDPESRRQRSLAPRRTLRPHENRN